jgi:hypothetical protein
MKIRIDKSTVDLSIPPYRGILSEIARERGVSRQAIQSSFKRGNPLIVELVTRKVMERKRTK